jgi:1-acyl-sn-glycerol-3-phosphate acyltransferase
VGFGQWVLVCLLLALTESGVEYVIFKSIKKVIMKNLISFSSSLWVTTNLLIGFALLLPISIISWLIPLPAVSRYCTFLADRIYHIAVTLDTFWMQRVLGIELVIKGKANTHQTPVVICNHQSWFDIPLVQHVISGNGPIIKFLVKREIVWIPVIGWICMVLNFPRLRRGKKNSKAESDFSIIQKASKGHGKETGALLIFPEGTRFSEAKRVNQKVPYLHLLKPKTGGLKMIKQYANADISLVDITIDYHQRNVHIWNCLRAHPAKITITLEHYSLAKIDDIETWLNNRWLEKDKLLSGQKCDAV